MKDRIIDKTQLPLVFKRGSHHVLNSDISENALKVISKLNHSGFEAYLVGGAVRDLLSNHKPKDFDIATDALPEQVHSLFKNSRLIGRRFRIVHVRFGREIIEVATFRGEHNEIVEPDSDDSQIINGMITRDNVYGTMEEDAWRRDFTVNALYYDQIQDTVIDFTGGLEDLNCKSIRIIGAPQQRYIEDPVRMLRVIRFSAKLGFQIESQTKLPLYDIGERKNVFK